jgi:hypothetical protein
MTKRLSLSASTVGRVLLLLAVVAVAGWAQATDISGTWVFQVTTDAGSGDPQFVLKQEGSKLTGKYSGALGDADVVGSVAGNKVTIEFTVSMGGDARIIYTGTIESATRMKGTVDLAGQASGTWTAEKK